MADTCSTEVGTLLCHHKGGLYVVVGYARDCDTLECLVLYKESHLLQDESVRPWARKRREFNDVVAWPDGVERTRYVTGGDPIPGRGGMRASDAESPASMRGATGVVEPPPGYVRPGLDWMKPKLLRSKLHYEDESADDADAIRARGEKA
ncbi:MAG: DUF1653 domain-containing protein [Polyangiales bacterium]